jgi:aspartate kinase
MNQLIVQKYGGTSVGSIDRIRCVAKKIIETKKRYGSVVAVVSAMGDSTDRLVEMAYSITEKPSEREMDMLLSTGEMVSISLLSMAIEAEGYEAVSLTGPQSGIITDLHHKNARILDIDTARVLRELDEGRIVVAAGFQGITEKRDIATLGRGGSDTTAVALAAALNAEKCEIYTDVDGIYTSDPRKVKNAKKLDVISYDEMLELAFLGAQVLHPRSVELARKFKVPLEVKSSFEDKPGTRIVEVDQVEKVVVRGVTLDEDIAKITIMEVPDRPGIAFKLFSELAGESIPIDMIIQNISRDNVNDVSFTLKKDHLEKALAISRRVSKEIMAKEVSFDDEVCKLSIVGTGIANSVDVASNLFESLFELGVNIQMISTSDIKISCIINKASGNEVLSHIHDRFILNDIAIEKKNENA